jgi:hypothetical protein
LLCLLFLHGLLSSLFLSYHSHFGNCFFLFVCFLQCLRLFHSVSRVGEVSVIRALGCIKLRAVGENLKLVKDSKAMATKQQ